VVGEEEGMLTLHGFVVSLAVFLAVLAPAHGASRGGALLTPGDFHGDEVSARSGERWLGLFSSPGGWQLRPATLRVSRVHDPIVDDQPSIRTGKRVKVGGPEKPLFLVRGAVLRPGPATTLLSQPTFLGAGTERKLRLRDTGYVLRVVSPGPPSEHITRDNARLELGAGRASQVLYALGGTGRETEATWRLLWAGDLDRDGRLDLYVEVSDHYNVTDRRLFLSGGATKGRLLRQVARLTTTGC
jgi:hypothetical protein